MSKTVCRKQGKEASANTGPEKLDKAFGERGLTNMHETNSSTAQLSPLSGMKAVETPTRPQATAARAAAATAAPLGTITTVASTTQLYGRATHMKTCGELKV